MVTLSMIVFVYCRKMKYFWLLNIDYFNIFKHILVALISFIVLSVEMLAIFLGSTIFSIVFSIVWMLEGIFVNMF